MTLCTQHIYYCNQRLQSVSRQRNVGSTVSSFIQTLQQDLTTLYKSLEPAEFQTGNKTFLQGQNLLVCCLAL